MTTYMYCIINEYDDDDNDDERAWLSPRDRTTLRVFGVICPQLVVNWNRNRLCKLGRISVKAVGLNMLQSCKLANVHSLWSVYQIWNAYNFHSKDRKVPILQK